MVRFPWIAGEHRCPRGFDGIFTAISDNLFKLNFVSASGLQVIRHAALVAERESFL
jgi:hypothetical protein